MAKSKKTAILGLFTALVIVLQMISYFVKIGTFSISLTLVPIVLAAVMYGPSYGAVLGAIFGAVTFIGAVVGIDAGGQMLFQANPIMLIVLCLSKATLAGLIPGLIAKTLKAKSPKSAVFLAAMSAPIVNTGIFLIMLTLFFKETLNIWAAGTDIAYYVVFSLVGINFCIEFLVNAILSPVILRIVNVFSK